MATELTTEGPPLAVLNQIRLLKKGETLKTDDIEYGSARTLASRVAKELERKFNVIRPKGQPIIYITRVV